MKFDDACKLFPTHSVVGGQLIAVIAGKHTVIGTHLDGHLIADLSATEVLQAAMHPLDHDEDGRKGGSKQGRKNRVKQDTLAPDNTSDVDASLPEEHIQLDLEDALAAADQVG